METCSELLAICVGNPPIPGDFPTQRPVTRSFDVFFDLRPNNRLSKQWWGWWFETPSSPLWGHFNVLECQYLSCVLSSVSQTLKCRAFMWGCVDVTRPHPMIQRLIPTSMCFFEILFLPVPSRSLFPVVHPDYAISIYQNFRHGFRTYMIQVATFTNMDQI